MSEELITAPDVHLPRDGGTMVQLAELRPKAVVLFFYPRANTSGCTREAKEFTELLTEFQSLNAEVFGISADSVSAQEKFVSKQNLGVALLSDEDQKVSEAFGVWKEKNMYGKTYMGIERSTFLIDGNGKIARAWRKVKVAGHVDEVLEAVKTLAASS